MSFEILEAPVVHAPLRTPIDGDRDYSDNTLSGLSLTTPVLVLSLFAAVLLWAKYTTPEDLEDEFYG